MTAVADEMESDLLGVEHVSECTTTINTHSSDNELITDNPLLKFIQQGNVKKVKQLMTVNSVNVNQVCSCWYHKSDISYTATPLTIAVRFASRRMVSVLLRNKRVVSRRRANPNVDCDLTPLGVVVEKGDPFLVAMLLHARADTQQRTLKLADLDGIGQQSLESDTHLNNIRTTPEQIAIQHKHIYVVMLLQEASDLSIGESTGTSDRYWVRLGHTNENHKNGSLTRQSADSDMGLSSFALHDESSASLQSQSSDSEQWQLHRACALGDVAAAKDLLRRGIDANKRDDYGYSPIHYACITNESKFIGLLKRKGADVNAMDSEGKTALQIALEIGNLHTAFSLINHGCTIPRCVLDSRNSRGNTLLHIACKQNQLLAALRLLASGASPDIINKHNKTPIFYAWSEDSEQLLRESLFRDCLFYINSEWGTRLYNAILREIQNPSPDCHIERGKHESLLLCPNCSKITFGIAYKLLKRGFLSFQMLQGTCCNSEDRLFGSPPYYGWFDWMSFQSRGNKIIAGLLSESVRSTSRLYYACSENETDIAMILINLGENVNYVDSRGCTPLHEACNSGNNVLITALTLQGARVNYADTNGDTPLHAACRENHEDAVVVLLEAGADIHRKNVDGDTCFHVACKKGLEHVVRLLVNAGAAVDRRNKSGNAPLHIACDEGHEDIVKVLLYEGADFDRKNAEGNTPLHIACYRGHSNIVRTLIEDGASMNRLNADGYNGMHIACERAHKDVLSIFLDKGADVDCVNTDGNTSLRIACRRGSRNVVSVLINNGADLRRVDDDGNTLLHIACEEGHKDLVILLIDSGIDVNLLNNNGKSPLRCAFDNNQVSLVVWMISSTTARVGKDVLYGFSKSRKTLLHMLCESNVDQITLLNFLDNGIRINGSGSSEYTYTGDYTYTTTCLFHFVKAYGLSFAKTLTEHGFVGCSRKCLQSISVAHLAQVPLSFIFRPTSILSLQNICQWWTWLTQAGVRITRLELTALEVADAGTELSALEMQWLKNEVASPRSLARQCIYAIRRHLVAIDPHGRSIHRSIDKLPLPTELKRQLKFQNTFDIEFS